MLIARNLARHSNLSLQAESYTSRLMLRKIGNQCGVNVSYSKPTLAFRWTTRGNNAAQAFRAPLKKMQTHSKHLMFGY